MATEYFIVAVDIPANVSADKFRDYIQEEVRINIGLRPDDDPFYDISYTSILVTRLLLLQAQA